MFLRCSSVCGARLEKLLLQPPLSPLSTFWFSVPPLTPLIYNHFQKVMVGILWMVSFFYWFSNFSNFFIGLVISVSDFANWWEQQQMEFSYAIGTKPSMTEPTKSKERHGNSAPGWVMGRCWSSSSPTCRSRSGQISLETDVLAWRVCFGYADRRSMMKAASKNHTSRTGPTPRGI